MARGTGFAVNAGGGADTGFALEDHAEMATTFPGLEASYEPLKKVVDRH